MGIGVIVPIAQASGKIAWSRDSLIMCVSSTDRTLKASLNNLVLIPGIPDDFVISILFIYFYITVKGTKRNLKVVLISGKQSSCVPGGVFGIPSANSFPFVA